MAGTSPTITAALAGLARALDAPRTGADLGRWRWTVRRELAAVRDALADAETAADDGWLAARGVAARREGAALRSRLAALGPRVLQDPAVERVRRDLLRLAVDISHHRQRLHDLAYDAVELELGGSE